jgi:Na+/H+-dicarboxylate symporter
MRWYRKLHWQIILGLVLGLIYGLVAANAGWGTFTAHWIAPFGAIFINLLKLIAIPLVLTSLVCGIASLSDLKKLSRMGGKTIALYLGTTVIAVVIGLALVNILQPGKKVPASMKDTLQSSYKEAAASKTMDAAKAKQRGPLQPLVDIVPSNFFSSASNNRNMLQVVFVALLIGIALIKVPINKAKPVLEVFQGLDSVVIQVVHIIMYTAPIGVFALLADTITSLAGDDPARIVELLGALAFYCVTVLLALCLHGFVVYPVLLKLFTSVKLKRFFSAIGPAQLLAFSTSSSGATLPVTMERCEKKLGISEEVSSFVLPLGATINMDGTALYQAVAAVFIAQVLGIDLSMAAQATIVLTAVLASIGTAAVPSAGIIMLVIILEALSVPSEGIALILGVDRILDMMRTTTNVTGDCTVATIIASSENQIQDPEVTVEAS